MPGRLALGGLIAAILLATPAAAEAAMSCTHSGPPANTVTFTTDDLEESLVLERVGSEIRLTSEHRVPVRRKKKKGFRFERVLEVAGCATRLPTVTNTDRVRVDINAEGEVELLVSLQGGPFAPGATPETSGSEIELDIRSRTSFQNPRFLGTEGADEIRFGSSAGLAAANLNPAAEPVPDVDATITASAPLSPRELSIWPSALAHGAGGADLITISGGPEFDGPFERSAFVVGGGGDDTLVVDSGIGADVFGGPGSDRIVAATRFTHVNAGRGADSVTGSDGREQVLLGPGKDRAELAGGKDEVVSRDGSRDRIDCGGGRDSVIKNRKDRLKRCERQRKRRPKFEQPQVVGG